MQNYYWYTWNHNVYQALVTIKEFFSLKANTQTYNKQQTDKKNTYTGEREWKKKGNINEQNGYMEDTLPFTT